MKSSAVVGLDQAADAVAAPGLSAAAIDVQLSQPFAAPKPDAPVASSAAGVSIGSTFDIVIHYGGDPAYQAAFDAAAARWEQIITGEIPDVNSGIFGLVDDLLIDASVVAIDGPGHVLAQAGPDYFRSGSSLPYHGVMQFDSADMAQMAANGTLTSVILHEMGHVLGIGTIWTSLGLASGYSYTGAHALAEYRTLTGNPGATSVPLETGGGPGTAGGHWSESVFNAELMTGYVETSGTAMPLSRVTIGALQDMGYTVNHGAADPFSLPPSTDDYADNLGDGSAPFGALATAGSATGNIEWTGDHDWFRIELTAGAAYTITLQGAGAGAGTLQDPYLRVYDGSGHLIAFDDDSDGNLCSRLVVAPASSGTYYVDASGYSDQCAGTYTVRVSGAAAIGGTSASDFLNGTDGSDTIAGLAGSDKVSGLGGSDFLYGNQDNDSLDAGSGENTVWAGQGDDYVTAQDGNDFLWGCEGADTLLGANGYNTIVGGSGAVDGGDLIAAGVGSDLIWGNGGNDTVAAGDGANTVIGGFGSDTLTAGPGNDVIFGNQDNDTIDAGDGANVILAGLGDDRIVSGSGNDTLYGNEGNDVMTGGTGADRYVFAAGSGFDQINGFTVFEGDRVDLQGQTFAQGTSGDGDLLLTLSGGGAIEFNGVNPTTFSPGFIA